MFKNTHNMCMEKILKNKKIIIGKKYEINIAEIISELLMIVIGTYLVSLGINLFLLPLKLTTGGVSGIATILYHKLGVSMGITVLILNIPVFIISIIKLGMKSSIKTIIATFLLSFFLDAFTYQSLVNQNITDLFTSCIFGGLIIGIGLSVVFKAGASTGGSDLLAQIIYKIFPVQSLSQVLLIIEFVIITSIVIAFRNINVGLYSLIAMFISTKMVDLMFEGTYYTRVVNIITKKPNEITEDILNELKRGVTQTKSIGARTKEEYTTLTCVITRPQVAKIKKILRKHDREGLMYIATTNEVLGKGFKSI